MPDITIQLRVRNESKSSVERQSLIDASNTLRIAEVADLLRGSFRTEDDLQQSSRLINFIVDPSRLSTFPEGELALDFLDRVYDRFVSKVEMQFCPTSVEGGQSILAVLAESRIRQAQVMVKSMVLKFGFSDCRALLERVGLSQGRLLKDLVVSSCEIRD